MHDDEPKRERDIRSQVVGAVEGGAATFAALEIAQVSASIVRGALLATAALTVIEVLAGLMVVFAGMFYAARAKGQAIRAITAAVFTGLTAFLYATHPVWDGPNILTGIVAALAIVAVVIPPMHRGGPNDELGPDDKPFSTVFSIRHWRRLSGSGIPTEPSSKP